MMEQMTIFDYMSTKSVCDGCVFHIDGACSHISGTDFGCIKGSFKIRKSKTKCPECGCMVEVRQARLGSDYAICRKCKKQIEFKNKGNRKTAFEMWKESARV